MSRPLHFLACLVFSAAAAVSTASAQQGSRLPSGAVEPAPATGSIKGRIVDESGQPVPNVVLSLASRNATRASAVSDDAGNFSFDGLGPGVYGFNVMSGLYTVVRDPSNQRGVLSDHRVGDFVTIRLTRGGVITGTVTNADGQPLIAAGVRAYLIRNPEGQAPPFSGAREYFTDDRGVYRIYGLPSGTYLVSAGGTQSFRGGGFVSPFDGDSPTYYPSTTPDTAAELTVREGQELNGIDIRYRGEQGHAVSGTIEGGPVVETLGQSGGVNPMLVHAATGMLQGQTYVSGREGERGFSFEGVPDGEYELIARRFGQGETEQYASAPLRVTVRGADVTGLKLTLAPLASIAGTLALEPLSKETRATSGCADLRPLLQEETVVTARRDEADATTKDARTRVGGLGSSAVPDASGAFTMRGLDPGRYRLGARSASDDWYVRSVILSAPPAPRRATSASKTASAKASPTPPAPPEFLQLTAGQKASAVKFTLAEGAASVRGRVAAAEESGPLPARLRVHLIPTTRERADDHVFFYETPLASDGSFAFTNVAPGRYLLLARPSTQTEADFGQPRPAAWDAAERAALRRAAEAANVALELNPCQRATDYTLRFKQ